MQELKITSIIFLYLAALSPTLLFSNSECETLDPSQKHAPLKIKNHTQIEFKLSEKSEDPNSEFYPIVVSVKNCITAELREFASLPYLGDAGKVENTFLADANNDGQDELFIIQSTEISSETGIAYASAYFTISIFDKKSDMEYSLNKILSDLFGAGGDILPANSNNQLDYAYPFKTQEDIKNTLASKNYASWLSKEPIETIVIDKTSIFNYSSIADKTQKYLIRGDKVLVNEQSSGWLKIAYASSKNGTIYGWIPCSKTKICRFTRSAINN